MKLYEEQQTEAMFQAQITDYATMRGWEYMHVKPSLTDRGRYLTAVSGSLGRGWPDLVLLRNGRLVIAEVKSAKGKLTPYQQRVLTLLAMVEGIRVHVWRPKDWPEIERVLM